MKTKTEIELEVVEYAKSVNWDFDKVKTYIGNSAVGLSWDEYKVLEGDLSHGKTEIIFYKYKPKQTITKISTLAELVGSSLEPKKIEIVSCLLDGCEAFNEYVNIEDYQELILISKNYGSKDVILGKSMNEKGVMEDTILFGHWNDGVL